MNWNPALPIVLVGAITLIGGAYDVAAGYASADVFTYERAPHVAGVPQAILDAPVRTYADRPVAPPRRPQSQPQPQDVERTPEQERAQRRRDLQSRMQSQSLRRNNEGNTRPR